jgi:hypothetical protein
MMCGAFIRKTNEDGNSIDFMKHCNDNFEQGTNLSRIKLVSSNINTFNYRNRINVNHIDKTHLHRLRFT